MRQSLAISVLRKVDIIVPGEPSDTGFIAGNVTNPRSLLEIRELVTIAGKLGLNIISLDLRRREDIAPAVEMLNGRAEALYVSTDPFILSNVDRINALAMSVRLPTIYNGKEYLQSGGLLSYGPNYPDLFRHAAELVTTFCAA